MSYYIAAWEIDCTVALETGCRLVLDFDCMPVEVTDCKPVEVTDCMAALETDYRLEAVNYTGFLCCLGVSLRDPSDKSY